MKTVAIVFLVVLMQAVKLSAAGAEADFTAANRLYAEGKFADAAKAYDALMAGGVHSAALWFNDANAHFKAGHLGHAIAAYRQAALLSPQNADIKANLDFVRRQVQGPTAQENRWTGGFSLLSLNEWTLVTVAAFWLTFITLIIFQLRPALAVSWRKVTWMLALVTVGCGGALAWQVSHHFASASAVIVSNEATARSGPFDEAQTSFTAHDGAELAVLGRHDDWVQVTDGRGRIGWLPGKLVAVLPGA